MLTLYHGQKGLHVLGTIHPSALSCEAQGESGRTAGILRDGECTASCVLEGPRVGHGRNRLTPPGDRV